MNDKGKRASERLYKEGLDSVTLKFTIASLDEKFKTHEFDFYLKVASFEGQVDLIDLTLGSSQEHNIRALIESNFKLGSKLIRDGVPLEKIVDHWEGYRFEPSGNCKQLVERYGYERPTVLSPLDCVAKILRARFLS